MRWRGVALIVVALLIGALLVPLALAAPRPQAAETLAVGYLGAPNSHTARGALLAMEQINSVGGFSAPDGTTYELELITLDAAPTIDSLPNDIAELTSQDVVALLGPDSSTLFTPENTDLLIDTGLPILTPATASGLTATDDTESIFRIRAPERVYSYALATYLATELELTSIALVQTDVTSTEALALFENALAEAEVEPAEKIQLPNGSALGEPAQQLASLNPEAVVMWGPASDAAALLQLLRDSGWAGRFAYRYAEEAASANIFPADLLEDMLGVTSWSYGYPGQTTRIFVLDYVTTFGQVPGPLAVAAYDATWYLRATIINQGVAPDAIKDGLIGGSPRTLVQGTLHPIDFANGDLARIAMVYELGPYGGPIIVAQFDDTQRLPVAAGQEVAQLPTAVPPTNTPGPPTDTPVPTVTLEGNWVQVTAQRLNVRSGPGLNYDRVGQIEAGEQYEIMGTSADYTWVVIDTDTGIGWVSVQYVDVIGNLATVPIIQPPPSPTPAATPTPTVPPNPDIVIDNVTLSPAQPIPGKPFTATVTVRNAGGGAAGRFAVAATWQPGAIYTASFVEGLAAGQMQQVQLSGTLPGTGVFQVGVVADLNKEVQEINEDNNVYNVTYRADYPLFAQQSGLQLNATTDWDLYGGTVDFQWDGFNIGMRNGAKIGILGGVTYENVHYDTISPAVITNTVGLTDNQVNPGVIVGILTAEGQRAVMRIDNRQGQTIFVSYRVYNSNP